MENETESTEPTLEEGIRLLLDEVPEPVRDFVLTKLNSKTQELMSRYGLHIDQGGLLERELLLMLLGQAQPTEFVAALQAGGIASQTVQSLASDINTEIFMKLHAEESGAASIVQQQVQPAPTQISQAPWPVTPASTPVPQQAPAPTVVPVPAYMPPTPPPAPEPTPSLSQFAPEPLYPTTPVPPATPPTATMVPPIAGTRTMAQDMAAASNNPVPSIPPAPQAPASMSVPAASPTTVVPEVATPNVTPLTQTPQPTVASANREALHAVLKEYGVDPYRELPD